MNVFIYVKGLHLCRAIQSHMCTSTLTILYDMIYLLTAIGLTPGGSSTVHIYTQTVHRTTQLTQTIRRTTQLIRTT